MHGTQQQAAIGTGRTTAPLHAARWVYAALTEAGYERVVVHAALFNTCLMYHYVHRGEQRHGVITINQAIQFGQGPCLRKLLAAYSETTEGAEQGIVDLVAKGMEKPWQTEPERVAAPSRDAEPEPEPEAVDVPVEVGLFNEAILDVKQGRVALDNIRQVTEGHVKRYGSNRELSLAITKIQEARHWMGECLKQYNFGRSCYQQGNNPNNVLVDPPADTA